jgi:asparagine synthase (glutamine-hydrolysing)
MCGIVGRFSVEAALHRGAVEGVATMTEAVRHRGPDAGGLLRKLARRYVPPEVLGLPKREFQIPLDRWLRQELRVPLEKGVLAEPDCGLGWVDRRVVARLWAEYQSGGFNHGYTFWTVWALRAWLQGMREAHAPFALSRDMVVVGAGT